MTLRIEARSAYVGRTTETLLPFHMATYLNDERTIHRCCACPVCQSRPSGFRYGVPDIGERPWSMLSAGNLCHQTPTIASVATKVIIAAIANTSRVGYWYQL